MSRVSKYEDDDVACNDVIPGKQRSPPNDTPLFSSRSLFSGTSLYFAVSSRGWKFKGMNQRWLCVKEWEEGKKVNHNATHNGWGTRKLKSIPLHWVSSSRFSFPHILTCKEEETARSRFPLTFRLSWWSCMSQSPMCYARYIHASCEEKEHHHTSCPHLQVFQPKSFILCALHSIYVS